MLCYIILKSPNGSCKKLLPIIFYTAILYASFVSTTYTVCPAYCNFSTSQGDCKLLDTYWNISIVKWQVQFPEEAGTFLFITRFRIALAPILLLYHWIPWALSLVVKWKVHETDYLPPQSQDLKCGELYFLFSCKPSWHST